MLGVMSLFLVLAAVAVVGAVVVMFLSVVAEGPAGAQRPARWRPPFAAGAALRNWAAGIAEIVAVRRLAKERTPSTPTELMQEIVDGTGAAFRHAAERPTDSVSMSACPGRRSPAVGVTAIEALALAERLRHNSAGERVHELAQQNAERLAADAGLAPATLPCPLLDSQGRCATYPLQPLQCRGWCAACVAGDGASAFGPEVGLGAVEGLARGLLHQGLDGRVYELNNALAAALSPQAAERWATGEEVFAGCASLREAKPIG